MESSGSAASFAAIGYPFTFTWVWDEAARERTLRPFEDPRGRGTVNGLTYLPYVLRQPRPDDQLDDGWYLYGVGHHELWCGLPVEDAVDAAQEHIAGDGSDPTNLPPVLDIEDNRSHKLLVRSDLWEDPEFWPYGRSPFGAPAG